MPDEKQYEKTQEVVHFPQQERARPPAVFSLVPKDLSEAIQLAKLIAESDLAPKDYRNKPGNVLIAVQMGQEVGLSPMAAIQSIAVINGKPSLYGDVGKALLLSNGLTIDETDIKDIKTCGYATCTITRPGHPVCTRTFGIDNAKTAKLWGKEGPWTTNPERQMAWRAFWFAARDIASDILKGLAGAEEVADYIEKDITPKGGTDSAEYQTGTQRLRGVVLAAPTLVEVCKAIGEANTPEAMLSAQELAKKLVSDEDKEAANLAYKARLADLKGKPVVVDNNHGEVVNRDDKVDNRADKVDKGTGEVIEHAAQEPAKPGAPQLKYSQIAHKLEKATDQDNLDAAADLIQYCTGGADQVEDLNKLYKRRRDEFKEGGSK